MSKRPAFGNHFEKLKALAAKNALNPAIVPAIEANRAVAVLPQRAVSSPFIEKTPSNLNPVQIEQSEKRTVSKSDPVQNESPEFFTKVPHSLLRGEYQFSDSLDFMIYLHLFTYSHGFGRKEADMSQNQLCRFTGAAKNTVKRSLERLEKEGWIKCIQEFECARMSRRYRVNISSKNIAKGTVAKLHSVQIEPSQNRIPSGSNLDPVTVSKIDPYIETTPKEKSKNSLSEDSQVIQKYLAAVKPFGKRESESRAYQGLKQDFQDSQISACLDHLLAQGVPGTGEPCHSPMGFLAKAMGQVWAVVQESRQKQQVREQKLLVASRRELEQVRAEEAEEQERLAREAAFVEAFPTQLEQEQVIAQYASQFPMLDPTGPVLRGLAIAKWWEGK